MFVRHEMYRDQMDAPRIANFAKHMHVDKVSWPTNVQLVKVHDMHFQMENRSSFGSSLVVISQNSDGWGKNRNLRHS